MQSIVVLVGVGILAFLTAAVGPLYVMDRFRDLREPTDPERAALDVMRRKAGLGPSSGSRRGSLPCSRSD